MSEERKPKWIEMLEKEIADLRSDFENLTKSFERMCEHETAVTEKLRNVATILETHKDNETFLMAFQVMEGSSIIDTELEEVRKYALERGRSVREAFEEMTLKGILPRSLRNLVEARKTIRLLRFITVIHGEIPLAIDFDFLEKVLFLCVDSCSW